MIASHSCRFEFKEKILLSLIEFLAWFYMILVDVRTRWNESWFDCDSENSVMFYSDRSLLSVFIEDCLDAWQKLFLLLLRDISHRDGGEGIKVPKYDTSIRLSISIASKKIHFESFLSQNMILLRITSSIDNIKKHTISSVFLFWK